MSYKDLETMQSDSYYSIAATEQHLENLKAIKANDNSGKLKLK